MHGHSHGGKPCGGHGGGGGHGHSHGGGGGGHGGHGGGGHGHSHGGRPCGGHGPGANGGQMPQMTPPHLIPLKRLFVPPGQNPERARPVMVDNKGKEVDAYEQIEGKCVALYMGMLEHPMCKSVTDKIHELSKQAAAKAGVPDLQVMYIGVERQPQEHAAALKALPDGWLTLPFMDRRLPQIMIGMQVMGFPTVVLYDEEHRFVTRQGRTTIEEEGMAAYPWRKDESIVREFKAAAQQDWQFNPSVVLLMEDLPADRQSTLLASLTKVAKESKDHGGDREPLFFYAKQPRMVSQQLRKMLRMPLEGQQDPRYTTPVLILLDVSKNGGDKYLHRGVVDEAGMRAFVKSFRDGSVKRWFVGEPRPAGDVNEADPDSPVGICVADSFDDLCLDESKTVLLNMFAMARSCRELMPHVEEAVMIMQPLLGPSFKAYHIDAESNELNSQYVAETHVPLLKLFQPGLKRAAPGLQAEEAKRMQKKKLAEKQGKEGETPQEDQEEEFMPRLDAAKIIRFVHGEIEKNAGAAKKLDLALALKNLRTLRAHQLRDATPALNRLYKQLSPVSRRACDPVLRSLGQSPAALDVQMGRISLVDNEGEALTLQDWQDMWKALVLGEEGEDKDVDVHVPELLTTIRAKLGIAAAQRTGVCTFSITGEDHVTQPFYACKTCSPEEGVGCCVVCAEKCHAGHELTKLEQDPDCYCDCGVGGLPNKCKCVE